MKQKKSRQGLRIVASRTPNGRNVKHYVKAKPAKATCTRCGAVLQGVPRAIPSKIRAMTRSKRRVNRKYGGVLCGKCVKDVEKYKTRMDGGYAVIRDLTVEKFLPAGWFASLPKTTQESSRDVLKPAKVERVEVTNGGIKLDEEPIPEEEHKAEKKAKKKKAEE